MNTRGESEPMLDPATIDPFSLPHVALKEKRLLPDCAGIYFVLSAERRLVYVGRTNSLKQRWITHHLLDRLHAVEGFKIAWCTVGTVAVLPDIEAALIAHFQPAMNREIVQKNKPRKEKRRPRAIIELPEGYKATWHAARVIALDKGITIGEFVIQALRAHLAAESKKK